jgi:hypothetical protein
MRHVYRSLTLMLLLITAQQGAVVHELSHFSADKSAGSSIVSGGVSDGACVLCPAFAQAASPAFGHSFHIPLLDRIEIERSAEPQIRVPDTAVPTPRSRGPPSLS